ncbi:MAG: galactokinase [Pelosinus sp.]|nr:galactokinase [Pelosinus sp.]
MNCLEQCQAAFLAQFGQKAEHVFFAPGRINLIGEHTDYNGGHVFPCALTFGTYALARKTSTREVRLYSLNFPDTGCITFSLDSLTYQKEHDWANYPKGMIAYLRAAGYDVSSGMDILYYGEIPNGAGLSSSASIELVTGVLLKGIFKLPIEQLELVKLGKQVENNFIGVNSGIMDQFAIGMGKAGHGILLDCDTLKYSYAPITIDNYNIVIMNTNKRRELADSKYNERRSECEAALKKLQTMLKIKSLGELDEQTFLQHQALIGDSILIKRARHAVTENARTLKALKALQQDKLQEFGELINQSHISLRDDYEVTGIELDTLAEASWQQSGVLGARMTGAGFGGCAIAIVEKDQTDSFILAVGKAYKEKIGYEATFYLASIGEGAREITKEANL